MGGAAHGRGRRPGLALAVVRDGEIAHLRGFGRAAPDGTPVTPQTPFMIGSLSKAFTALAVAQLAERGALQIDAPARRYLPWPEPVDERLRAVTVRQLLQQTSGFSTFDGRRFFDRERADSIEAEVRSYASLRLVETPGARFHYSNLNYAALGAIVERVSGESYAEYLRRNVFEPLDMRHSFATEQAARRDGLAMGHRYWYGRPRPSGELWFLPGFVPAAYVASSAEDFAHWLVAHLEGGRYAGRSVLGPEWMARLHTPGPPTEEPPGAYAMGWFVSDLDGATAVWHPGDLPGYRAVAILDPHARLGVAVLFNANTALDGGRLDAVAMGVWSLLRGHEPQLPGADPMYFGLLGLVALLLLAQAAGIAQSAAHARRRRRPALWPLALDVLFPALVLALPPYFEVPLRTLLVFQPDVAIPYLVVLGVATAGAAARVTWLVAWHLRRTPAARSGT